METQEAQQQKVKAQLDKLDAQVEEMKAKAAQATADAKVKYYEQLETLEKKRQTAHSRFDELKASSKSAWQEIKIGVDAAVNDLRHAFDQAMAKF